MIYRGTLQKSVENIKDKKKSSLFDFLSTSKINQVKDADPINESKPTDAIVVASVEENTSTRDVSTTNTKELTEVSVGGRKLVFEMHI